MVDNKTLPPTGTGTADIRVATRSVTYSGDVADVQAVGIVLLAGSDDAKTATDIAATAAAALPVRSIGTETNAGAQVTVTNSSTTIVSADADRRGVLILNFQTVPVYIDPSGGTATTSMFRLDPGASIFLPVTTAVTGITSAAYTASGDAKVHTVTVA